MAHQLVRQFRSAFRRQGLFRSVFVFEPASDCALQISVRILFFGQQTQFFRLFFSGNPVQADFSVIQEFMPGQAIFRNDRVFLKRLAKIFSA